MIHQLPVPSGPDWEDVRSIHYYEGEDYFELRGYSVHRNERVAVKLTRSELTYKRMAGDPQSSRQASYLLDFIVDRVTGIPAPMRGVSPDNTTLLLL